MHRAVVAVLFLELAWQVKPKINPSGGIVWNSNYRSNSFVDFATAAGRVAELKPPGNDNSFEAAIGPVSGIGEHTRQIFRKLEFKDVAIDEFNVYKADKCSKQVTRQRCSQI